jgi:hypothetical protein
MLRVLTFNAIMLSVGWQIVVAPNIQQFLLLFFTITVHFPLDGSTYSGNKLGL